MGRIDVVAFRLGRVWRFGSAWARRRPKTTLVAAVILALVASLAHDLFFAIPWPVRKVAGWAGFFAVGAALLARLWDVRPDDRDAPPLRPAESGRWSGFVVPVVGVALAIPFVREAGNLGSGDWDFFLEKAEAVRRSILEFGQFPWWDPWSRGGFPLAANPQCGVIGVGTPLTLLFGSSVGMRLAAIACLAIATEGARRLARLWLGDPVAATAVALVYGINGGVLVQAFAGYYTPMSYCAFPWLLLHVARLDRSRSDGLWLGAWLAFNVLNGIQYYTAYAAMIAAVAWLRGVRARRGEARARMLVHTAIALGVFFALAGWRLATTALVHADYPRHHTSHLDESPAKVLTHLLNRPTAEILLNDRGTYIWDTTCYIGPIVLLLAASSLVRGWRWWHALAFGCGVLAVGSVSFYHPSYWLAHGPVFATMHMVGRWRIMAMLGVGLAAGDELASWRAGNPGWRRWLAPALVAAIGADYVTLGRELLPAAFRVAPDESRFPGPPTAEIVQVGTGMAFPAALRGYGMIVMPEPLLGYDQSAPTARTYRGQAGYRGEAWTAAGPIRPRSWSPNRIEFDVAPGQVVSLNQNPGSWWLANGRPLMPGSRCVETRRPFEVTADPSGRLVLEIRPRGLNAALALHLAGIVLAGAAWHGARAGGNRI